MAAVERVKLRMKIGVHELEAEGPRELVMAQLDIWTRLAGLPAATAGDRVADDGDPALRGLFAVDAERQLVTLRASLNGQRSNADAALLLLYGYQPAWAERAEWKSLPPACAPRWWPPATA